MLSIGMTYEQYWYGDPLMAKKYFEADKLKRKRTHEELWLQGIYMSYAIQATIGNAFLGKGKPPFEYPQKPLIADNENDVIEETEKEKEAREKQEVLRARLYMENMVRAGKNWGKKPN